MKFLTRPARPEDQDTLRQMWARSGRPFFPDPAHKWRPFSYVVEHEGRIVALMTGRVAIEVELVTDPTFGSKMDRLRALKRLFKAFARAAWRFGIEYLICPIDPGFPRFAEGLEKRAGFIRIDSVPLIFDLTREYGKVPDGK